MCQNTYLFNNKHVNHKICQIAIRRPGEITLILFGPGPPRLYTFFNMDVEEDKVMWWTGLQEPPEDVLELLEFLLGNFKDPHRAPHRAFWEPFKELIEKYRGNQKSTKIG